MIRNDLVEFAGIDVRQLRIEFLQSTPIRLALTQLHSKRAFVRMTRQLLPDTTILTEYLSIFEIAPNFREFGIPSDAALFC